MECILLCYKCTLLNSFISTENCIFPGITHISGRLSICCYLFAKPEYSIHVIIITNSIKVDLVPKRLQIYANNVSRYMRQRYGQRSFPDVFLLTLWGLEMYAYKQRKWLQVTALHCNTFIE